MTPKELAAKVAPYVTEMRHTFHAHPELSGKEEWTSARIAEELAAAGIPYEIVGNRNVVGLVDSGKPGKALAIRADFDALPLNEELDLPYRSQIPGCMHACGHDVHAACLLGVGRALTEMKDRFSGKVYLCFQTAEEAGRGADEIVAWLKARGGVDNAIAMHIAGAMAPGTVEVREGARYSGCEIFYIDIKGVGGHGSRPDLAVDPIKAAVDVYNRLLWLPGHGHSMFRTCVVSPCCLQAGERFNIIPETAHLEGTIRYYTLGDDDIVMGKIEQMAQAVCASHGCTVKVSRASGAKYPLINDPAAVALGRRAAAAVGLQLDDSREPSAGSDNFAEFLVEFPGFYASMGTQSSRPGSSGNHHSPNFDVEESTFGPSVEFFLTCVELFLG